MKKRLDILLTENGMFSSREKAKASIMAGIVMVDGQRVDKAGTQVSEDAEITLKENLCPYVSRGGLKLEKAVEEFDINISGAVAMDIGASTGGFTDCMLSKGAVKVFAVDVGYGQLDWKLRNDERVINMEKTNIRYLDLDSVDKNLDLISIDVSFISLKLVLPVASELISDTGIIVSLVKPQFEAGREQVGKNGIVRDPEVHLEVLRNAVKYGTENGLDSCGITFSPVKGAKGNIEYLMIYRKKCPEDTVLTDDDLKNIVSLSHEELK